MTSFKEYVTGETEEETTETEETEDETTDEETK